MSVYQKGSEWRKWDLHVHSPYSKGFQGTWDQFVEQTKSAECDVIGINDYFSVAGYKRITQEITSGNVDIDSKILFPVVEMRMTDTVQNKHNKTKGITHFNFHIIFNNDHEKLKIEDIELFIKSLESNNTMIGSDYDDKEKLQSKKVSFRNTLDKLESDTKFKGNYLIWLPYDEYGGIDDIDPTSDGWIKENFKKDSHILGSSRQAQIDFFHWKSPMNSSGEPKYNDNHFKSWFNSKKPCIKGSDSHHFSYPIGKLKDKNSNPIEKYCWIKADPTFQGLEQIVHEPEERVHIGSIPESIKRASQHPTKVIRNVAVYKRSESKIDEKWFDFDLPLNSGFVAIIGNKGSGKSALADILGLLGNTKRYKKFSFLTKEKFCSTRRGKAKYFNAALTWSDNKVKEIEKLEASHDPSSQERVKYIPQSYLEDICSEVGFSEEGAFYSELKEVIFSRVKESDRLGFDNIDSLLKHRDKEIENRIDQLISGIKALNRDIVEIEEKMSEDHLREIQAALEAKKNELEAHDSDSIKPEPVPKPADEKNEHALAEQMQLESKKEELDRVKKSIQGENQKDIDFARSEANIQKIEKQIDNIKKYVDDSLLSLSEELNALGMKSEDIISLNINRKLLTDKLNTITQSRTAIKEKLDAEIDGSLASRKEQLNEEIVSLTKKLSEPQKKYQAYLEQFTQWQALRTEIVGDVNTIGSKSYYEDQITMIEGSFPVQRNELVRARLRKSLEIFREKLYLRDHYAKYYGSVQQYLDSYPIESVKNFRITFDVSISEWSFADQFLDHINQGKTGNFYGAIEGAEKVSSLLDS